MHVPHDRKDTVTLSWTDRGGIATAAVLLIGLIGGMYNRISILESKQEHTSESLQQMRADNNEALGYIWQEIRDLRSSSGVRRQ